MSDNIYVGNLPYTSTEEDVRGMFSEYGNVTSVALITDRETGRPRGFGFVEMESGGAQAIEALDQTEIGGRRLNVRVAHPRR